MIIVKVLCFPVIFFISFFFTHSDLNHETRLNSFLNTLFLFDTQKQLCSAKDLSIKIHRRLIFHWLKYKIIPTAILASYPNRIVRASEPDLGHFLSELLRISAPEINVVWTSMQKHIPMAHWEFFGDAKGFENRSRYFYVWAHDSMS